ncbi:conserved hypothetical protein [Microcystis aeruginosa PCC 9809]|jgi:hypothetical protein|uniref:HepT-like domain-containing protein n=4 Tax=Microcystaceae TaxID=1890449 RepID=I4I103_MICAE|nr:MULTISPECIES: hypothetical protein [Microcystis]REJ48473.1 MAG: hypothetical protein DWQ53_05915 [Microcystis flos-aquae DF17]BAG01285.1 hypothetical protein MAE_14630 [Microcystis aeruginosa NIES-843]BBH42204.1 hypothetical protein myaer102_48480 [Microcystis viridis NIES-102]MDJ0671583.1 hypothetical protein [Microcystis sp. M53598_WE2]CCI27977.1 conserved hypothetical protein [Microcystis aeruginosa PCC 9809]
MRPMSASELQEIALDIATEVNRLNRLESQMRLVQAEMLTNPALADICAESLALKLDNFYTGCERIFQIIASELNGGLPSSYDWHRRLLNRMSKPQDYRPAVLREDTVHKLNEYLSFRHVVRNIYGFELEKQKLENLVNNYYNTWRQVQEDINSFILWLKTTADSLN